MYITAVPCRYQKLKLGEYIFKQGGTAQGDASLCNSYTETLFLIWQGVGGI